jgi:hypothetical protein
MDSFPNIQEKSLVESQYSPSDEESVRHWTEEEEKVLVRKFVPTFREL